MDSQTQAIQFGVESFYSSNRGEAYKSRMLLWGFSLIGLTVSALRAPHGGISIAVMATFFLVIVGLVDYFLLRQFRPGQLVVKLTEEGVESPMISGSTKKLPWISIKGISIQAIHDQSYLVFELSPDLGADTELGNYRTLGKCHLARRSLECPQETFAVLVLQWRVSEWSSRTEHGLTENSSAEADIGQAIIGRRVSSGQQPLGQISFAFTFSKPVSCCSKTSH